MMRSGRLRSLKNPGGFTTLELMVTLVLGLIVLTGVYKMLISYSRLYGVQREAMDTRRSLRTAAALLSWELASAAATAGDLYAIGPDSLSLRSLQGTGVICAPITIGPKKRYALQLASGYFEGTADDSALVYDVAAKAWKAVRVSKAFNQAQSWLAAPTGGGTPVCFWGDSTVNVPRPQATVELEGDSIVLAGLEVGAPLRAFRRTEYALFQQDGRWWLGRRVGAAASYEIVTGPLLSPSDSGLVFTYYDATGAVTADPVQVSRVDIALRAESFGRTPALANGTLRDALTTTVLLRGNAAP